MVPLLPLRDGVRALPISFFRQSMPSFYMNAPDCICSPGRLPLGAFCTGRDGRYGQDWPTRCAFQSAHPVRGATGGSAEAANGMVDFNPRTPCGVRRPVLAHRTADTEFQSTHPVRGATELAWGNAPGTVFQSTHPVRGATIADVEIMLEQIFQSTHPVRGATSLWTCSIRQTTDFNPRTPCGVRRLGANLIM